MKKLSEICKRLRVCETNVSIDYDVTGITTDSRTVEKGNVFVVTDRLKERRAALNVNQQEMGRLYGVSRQTISLIERGDYSPSVTLALTIAKVCGVTVEEIFYLQEDAGNEQ